MDFSAIIKSKTLWGVLLMAIPVISKALGNEVSASDAASVVTATQTLVTDALSWVGIVMAVWGRFTAKGPLINASK